MGETPRTQEATKVIKIGDLVRIKSEPWNMFAGQLVILTKSEIVNGVTVYDFVIPKRRGWVPEQLIDRVILPVEKWGGAQ